MENRNLKMRGMALLLAAAVTGSGFWMMPAEKGVEAQAAAVQDLENEITQYEGYELVWNGRNQNKGKLALRQI